MRCLALVFGLGLACACTIHVEPAPVDIQTAGEPPVTLPATPDAGSVDISEDASGQAQSDTGADVVIAEASAEDADDAALDAPSPPIDSGPRDAAPPIDAAPPVDAGPPDAAADYGSCPGYTTYVVAPNTCLYVHGAGTYIGDGSLTVPDCSAVYSLSLLYNSGTSKSCAGFPNSGESSYAVWLSSGVQVVHYPGVNGHCPLEVVADCGI